MLVRLEEGGTQCVGDIGGRRLTMFWLDWRKGAPNVLVRLEEGGTQCVGEIGGRRLSMCW